MQAVTDAIGGDVGSGPRIDVVIELEIADAEILHKPINHFVEVSDGRRVAQVEVIPTVLHDALPVTLEERSLREPRGHQALHPDDFGFQPEPRHHPRVADRVDDFTDPGGESSGRRSPFPDAVPPVASVVVPASVDAEDLGADVRGGRDEEGVGP